MLGMTEPFIAIPSAVLVILSGSLVILSAILLILSASLVILSAVEGSLLPMLKSCREILWFTLLSQNDRVCVGRTALRLIPQPDLSSRQRQATRDLHANT